MAFTAHIALSSSKLWFMRHQTARWVWFWRFIFLDFGLRLIFNIILQSFWGQQFFRKSNFFDVYQKWMHHCNKISNEAKTKIIKFSCLCIVPNANVHFQAACCAEVWRWTNALCSKIIVCDIILSRDVQSPALSPLSSMLHTARADCRTRKGFSPH